MRTHLTKNQAKVAKRSFLFTGCPRSGTYYTYTLLKKLGVRVQHERLGLEATVSFFYAPYTIARHFKETIHIVRNPIKCIASMTTARVPSWKHFFRFIPAVPIRDKVFASMYIWYHWNKMVDSYTKRLIRIEDLDQGLAIALLETLKYPIKNEYRSEKIAVSTTINTRKHIQLTWEDLKKKDANLFYKIKKLSHQYGYEIGG